MKRKLSIDVLKIILAFFVVFLHMHLLKDSFPMLGYVLVNGLFRMAVPVFLIITGYYFYHIDNIEKLKKWSFRILLLYLIWSLIYMPVWKENNAFTYFLFGYHHLWYLIGTFFSGILLYILKRKSAKSLIALILCLFCIGYGIQLLANIHYFTGETDSILNFYPTYRNFLLVCFPFLAIGFLINKLHIKVSSKYGFLYVLLCVILVLAESYLNFKYMNSKENVDLLFSLLIACPVVFLYCRNLPAHTDSKILASVSTAIYLIHPMLMRFILESGIPYCIPIFFSVLIVTSIVLVLINRKIKYLL